MKYAKMIAVGVLGVAIALETGTGRARAQQGSSSSAALSGIPLNVKIPAELTAQVTSLTVHAGDTFSFKTGADEMLGAIFVPKGTPGHGRIAVATPAHDKERGALSLQADSIDLPDGRMISVNMDASRPIRGHLSDKKTRFTIIPVVIAIVPISRTTVSGNMVLDSGTRFGIVTTTARAVPAPLVTAQPHPSPTASSTVSPLPTASATP